MPPLLRFVDRPFIMPIVDKYKDMGTVVLGKVEAGEARKGQTLLVLPNKVLSSFHAQSFRSCNISIFYSPTVLDAGGS